MLPRTFNITFLPSYLISSVGILANLMLLIAFVKDPLKCFRNSATYLVGNLAISDMMFSVSMIASVDDNPKNKINSFLRSFSFYLSMCSIFSIAFDRYTMVSYPFKHRLFMKRNKMALWIAFIWFLSSLLPIINTLVRIDFNKQIVPGIGFVVIILTGILYAKTYVALKKQAKLMADRKVTLSGKANGKRNDRGDASNIRTSVSQAKSSDISVCVSPPIDSKESGNKCNSNEKGRYSYHVQSDHQREEKSNEGVEIAVGYVEDVNKRVKDPIKRDENQNIRVENRMEHVEDGNKRDKDPNKPDENRNKHVESDIEVVEDGDKSAKSKIERVEHRNERVDNPIERGEDGNERVENQIERDDDRSKRAQNEIERSQNTNDGFDIDSRPTSTSSKMLSVSSIASHSYCNKVSNNVGEQKFLKTIIIIAVIATITVFPATIYESLFITVFESNDILDSLFTTILCLNFSVNPFVYYMRLKRYRQTFKIVYGCKP